ncbi:MAG: hypothetical protein ACI4OT_05090 [Bacilli bacterium]
MDNKENKIIKLYNEGNRPSKIRIMMGKEISVEDITAIIDNYRSNEYLTKEVSGIKYDNILNLYLSNKTPIDIMLIYPELSFGEIKDVISGYYEMFSIKKPYKIKFPKVLIEEELKTKTIEEVSKEYSYSEDKIKRELNLVLTKEELFAQKMQILERDAKVLSTKKFNNKYKNIGLDKPNAKRLILEYKSKC